MAKQLENVFTLADLQGHFLRNFHAKDLKPRITREEKETISEESDVEPEDRDSAPAEKNSSKWFTRENSRAVGITTRNVQRNY